MDENRQNRTDYEPNFILQGESDAAENEAADSFAEEPAADSGAEFSSESVSNSVNTFNQYSEHEASSSDDPMPQDHSDIGTYRDPRAGFSAGGRQSAGMKHSSRKYRTSTPVVMTRRTLALLIVLVMVISVVFGGTAAVVANSVMARDSSSSSRTASGSRNYTLEDATDSSMSIADITEKTQDSVVEIRTESVSSDTWMREYVTEGAGSGVIITTDGYIVTNNHVIENASKITVTTTDDKEYSAKLVGTDTINDIAVIKINASNLQSATYGNSDQLEVGEMAVAIGNPLGELGGSVTSGIISALDREVNIDGSTMTLLQTDASINPGNSGGGLFNDDGQLIGIVVAKSSGSDIDNIGFAIPVNTVADVADQLMKNGYVSNQPSTGMSYTEQSMGGSHYLGDYGDSDGSAYVFIAEVNGKNAKAAGFKEGDLVYAIDGQVIDSFNTLSSIITSKKVGDKVKYTIVRDNMTKDITLELEEKTN